MADFELAVVDRDLLEDLRYRSIGDVYLTALTPFMLTDCIYVQIVYRRMGVGREFLVSIRIMVHTLVDHMVGCFPDPWQSEPSPSETKDVEATIDDLESLADELEYLFIHAQKLSKQIVRSHGLIRSGEQCQSAQHVC